MKVHFQTASGETVTAEAKPGDDLLTVAQNAGLPLEGTCEGQMACSTCHVVLAPEWFDALPDASEEEEDMLDLAAGVARTSRLACQIVLGDGHEGLIASIPTESHDARRF